MTHEEQRELAIQRITDMLRDSAFQLVYKVKSRPQGIKIIVEVTQEQIDELLHPQKTED